MELLKTLKLTCYQRNTPHNPALQRRIKLAAGISEQIELAENPNYESHSVRTVANDSGEVREVEVGKRVLVGGVLVLMVLLSLLYAMAAGA